MPAYCKPYHYTGNPRIVKENFRFSGISGGFAKSNIKCKEEKVLSCTIFLQGGGDQVHMQAGYFNLEERRQLAEAWEGGQSVRQIAKTMGVHETTIYRELRRGEVGTNVLDGNYRRRYDPELAQKRFMEHLYSRPMGRPRKTGN